MMLDLQGEPSRGGEVGGGEVVMTTCFQNVQKGYNPVSKVILPDTVLLTIVLKTA